MLTRLSLGLYINGDRARPCEAVRPRRGPREELGVGYLLSVTEESSYEGNLVGVMIQVSGCGNSSRSQTKPQNARV